MAYANPPQTTDLIYGCACAIIFILFLALDAWKAIKRKAYSLPGAFLVISALTLQFLNFVDYSTVSITPDINYIEYGDVEKFLKAQLVIDSGRLVMCVFIAYLLPGLATYGFRTVWADLGGVTISALTHMFYEMYLVFYWSDVFPFPVTAWFEEFSGMVFIALIFLVLLSVSAVVAGKTIHIMMNEKVSSLLECCNSNSHTRCRSIGDHVLKCWIIVRSSQPENVVARSVLTSFAGLLVTVCIVVFSVKWASVYIDDYKTIPPLNKTTLVLQFIFVLIGWIMVSVRWIRAVIYFPIHGLRSVFHVEDFWTRCINDLKYGQLNGPLFRGIRYRNRTLLENNIMDLIIQFRLYSLSLSIASSVQQIIVLNSKASSFFSWIMLSPLLMIRGKIMFFCGSNNQESEISIYTEILEKIRMPGESANNMWIANELGFKSTRKHMAQGRCSTAAMIEIIRHRTKPAADGGEETQVEEETYFKFFGKRSWKMEAVSLIHLMLSLYDDTNFGVVDEAMKACCEAWPLMDFIETPDTEVNLLGLAADKDFHTLENIWKKMKSAKSDKVRNIMRDRMQKNMKNRIFKGKSQGRVDSMEDSMDWIMAAANFNLNKTSEKVGYPLDNTIDKSMSLLANVIVDGWAKARNNAIIEKCNKWVVDGKEEEIYHAAFIAGKAMSGPEILQTSQANNAVNPTVTGGNGNSSTGNETVDAGGENDPDYTEQIVDGVQDVGGAIEDAAESDGDNNC